MKLRGHVPNSYIHESVSNLYIPGFVCLFGCSKLGRPIWEYINRSQIHECGNWETEHFNSVFEITRMHSSFLETHISEPDIYIGFSPALQLQCTVLYINSHVVYNLHYLQDECETQRDNGYKIYCSRLFQTVLHPSTQTPYFKGRW
jgi:hypothetical protein